MYGSTAVVQKYFFIIWNFAELVIYLFNQIMFENKVYDNAILKMHSNKLSHIHEARIYTNESNIPLSEATVC